MSDSGGVVARLLARLDLETLDRDLFLGDPGRGRGRLFGGMVAAQSVVAAGRTITSGASLHSLHAYFLRPGRHDLPIRFVVDRIRDGRTFTTRRVNLLAQEHAAAAGLGALTDHDLRSRRRGAASSGFMP